MENQKVNINFNDPVNQYNIETKIKQELHEIYIKQEPDLATLHTEIKIESPVPNDTTDKSNKKPNRNTKYNELTCETCSKVLPTAQALKVHQRLHTGEKPFQCDVCSEAFLWADQLKNHKKTAHPPVEYECDKCSLIFNDYSVFQIHTDMYCKKALKCDLCPTLTFKTKYFLERHQRTHKEKQKLAKCDICEKSFMYNYNLNRHRLSHERSKVFQCHACAKTFELKTQMEDHIKTVHYTAQQSVKLQEPAQCEFCEKTFVHRYYLERHKLVYGCAKQFKCDQCSKMFCFDTQLTKHKIKSHGEKKKELFQCEICQKTVSRKYHLTQHRLLHVYLKPFQCYNCLGVFKSDSQLSEHRRTVHQIVEDDQNNIYSSMKDQENGLKPFQYNIYLNTFVPGPQSIKNHGSELQVPSEEHNRTTNMSSEKHQNDVYVFPDKLPENAHPKSIKSEKGSELHVRLEDCDRIVDTPIEKNLNVIHLLSENLEEDVHQIPVKYENELHNRVIDTPLENHRNVAGQNGHSKPDTSIEEYQDKPIKDAVKPANVLHVPLEEHDRTVNTIVEKNLNDIHLLSENLEEDVHQIPVKNKNELHVSSEEHNRVVDTPLGKHQNVAGQDTHSKSDTPPEEYQGEPIKDTIKDANVLHVPLERIINTLVEEHLNDIRLLSENLEEDVHKIPVKHQNELHVSQEEHNRVVDTPLEKHQNIAGQDAHPKPDTSLEDYQDEHIKEAAKNANLLHVPLEEHNRIVNTPVEKHLNNIHVLSENLEEDVHQIPAKHENVSPEAHNRVVDTPLKKSQNVAGKDTHLKPVNNENELHTLPEGISSLPKKYNERKTKEKQKNNVSLPSEKFQKSDNEKHSCSICLKKFSEPTSLTEHMLIHKDPLYKCKFCPKTFRQKQSLAKHERARNCMGPFQCDVCSRIYVSARALYEHKREYHVRPKKSVQYISESSAELEKKRECRICLKTFSKSSSLTNHMAAQHGLRRDGIHKCKFCPKTFQTTQNLRRHERLHTGMEPLKCDMCPMTFSLEYKLVEHKQDAHSHMRMKCNICATQFDTLSEFQKHMAAHHHAAADSGMEKFLCHLCWRSYSKSYDLIQHTRHNHGERNYLCAFCPKMFIMRSKLVKHEEIHLLEREFKCDKCSMRFFVAEQLEAHRKTHANERKLFKSRLKRQQKVQTSGPPYTCNICGKVFTSIWGMDTHHHNSQLFKALTKGKKIGIVRFFNL